MLYDSQYILIGNKGTFQVETHKMISSARFPMVMLRRAPAVSPKSLDILSVASVSVIDSGTIARRFQMNITSAGLWVLEIMTADAANAPEKMILGLTICFVCCLNMEIELQGLPWWGQTEEPSSLGSCVLSGRRKFFTLWKMSSDPEFVEASSACP